jgi:hypothetical protein
MSTKLEVSKPNIEKFEPTGATDGKHHFFRCLSCKAPLADVWVTYPNPEIVWNFVAECPHCGGLSQKESIEGMFVIGKNEDSEEYTSVIGYDIDKDPITIKTQQVKKYEQKRSRR